MKSRIQKGRVACQRADGNLNFFENGYDICPDVLRFYCERGGVASQTETDAFFALAGAETDGVTVGQIAEDKDGYGAGAGNAQRSAFK